MGMKGTMVGADGRRKLRSRHPRGAAGAMLLRKGCKKGVSAATPSQQEEM